MWRQAVVLLLLATANHARLVEQIEVATKVSHLDLLRQIAQEQPFDMVFLFDCDDDALLRQLRLPVLLLPYDEDIYLRPQFSSSAVAVAYVPQQVAEAAFKALEILAQMLNHMRYVRIVLVVADAESMAHIDAMLRQCRQLKLSNVIALQPLEFSEFGIYHGYKIFRQFRRERRSLHSSATIFPDQFQNMDGYSVRSYADQNEPSRIIYNTSDGSPQFSGYIAKLLLTFLPRYNATLTFPYSVCYDPIYFEDMLNFTRNDSLDIPMGIVLSFDRINPYEFSYPYESMDLCLMVPLQGELSKAELYLWLMTVDRLLLMASVAVVCLSSGILVLKAYLRRRDQSEHLWNWPDLVVNDKAVQGVLGISFHYGVRKLSLSARIIFMVLFLLGLMNVTTYESFLKSYLMQPPQKPEIDSWETLEASGLKVCIGREEFEMMQPNVEQRYYKLFELKEKLREYTHLRNTLNISYGYFLDPKRWHLFEMQQNKFSRRIFRRSSNICLIKFVYLYLVLNENSVFHHMLHSMILDAHAYGFYGHWLSSTFYDLVNFGIIPYEDLSIPWQITSLSPGDLIWLWLTYAVGIGAGIVCLAAELMGSHFQTRRARRTKIIIVKSPAIV